MIKKGVISNIAGATAEVFFPDENYAVTPMLPFAKSIELNTVSIGDICVVGFFDADNTSFADGAILAII